jgi:hypothetical protein
VLKHFLAFVVLHAVFFSLMTNSSVTTTNTIAVFSIVVVWTTTLGKTMAGCRANKLTPEQRKEMAQKEARARWGK